jgi:NAD(P)-dependent dehydrogenase (short-subunit alcohol dehydrogenase family)
VADLGFDLSGRRAIVTGASAGIGASIAVRLASAGADVVAVSRSGRAPDCEVEPIIGLAADLSARADLDQVVAEATERLGGLDILVNNAGRGDWVPIEALDRAHFDEMVDLNLWAPLRLCQLAHPHLATSRHGSVVMIGSVDAVRPSAGSVVYGATKAGLAAVTISLAKAWGTDGITVNQINPGLVETPMSTEVVEALSVAGESINISGRPGTGDEIAGLVHYLVSGAGRFATGSTFTVDGGALALGPFDGRQTGRFDGKQRGSQDG